MIRAEFVRVGEDVREVLTEMMWNDGRLTNRRFKMLKDEGQYLAQEVSFMDEGISCWIYSEHGIVGQIYFSFDFTNDIEDCKYSPYYYFQHMSAISNNCESSLRTSDKRW